MTQQQIAALVLCGMFSVPAPPASPAPQVAFEQAVKDLASPDPSVRLRTVQMLKDAAYPEAADPLAALVTDPQDEVQFEEPVEERTLRRIPGG